MIATAYMIGLVSVSDLCEPNTYQAHVNILKTHQRCQLELESRKGRKDDFGFAISLFAKEVS